MADITTHSHNRAARFSLASFFRAIADGLVAISEGNRRVRHAEALHRLSDAELAKRGLKRQDIARHVFGDLFHI